MARDSGAKTNFLIVIVLFVLATTFWYFYFLNHDDIKVNFLYPHNTDIYNHYLPKFQFFFDQIRTGTIPLWNPYEVCGEAFLGAALGILYPLNFLYVFVPLSLAMGMTTLLHIFLAGLFMYLWTRTIGLAQFGSFVSAITFSFSTFVVIHSWYPSLINTLAWTPALFLLTEKIVRRKTILWTSLLALALACQMLAGAIQFVFYTLYALAAYLICRLAWVSKTEGYRAAASVSILVAVAVLVAVMLSAVQILPSLEASMLGARSPSKLSLRAIEVFSDRVLKPREILPQLMRPEPLTATLYAVHVRTIYSFLYIGIVPVLLVGLSLTARRCWRYKGFFLVLGLVALTLSAGSATPLYRLYYSLPTGAWFRVPDRFLSLFVFSAAIMAGMGADRLTGMTREKGNPARWTAIGTGVFLSALVVLWAPMLAKLYACLFLLLVLCVFFSTDGADGYRCWEFPL